MYTEISNGTHYSVNTDNNHNACNTSDEDLRPVKRQKPRSAPAVTPLLYLRLSPPFESPSTTIPKIDEAQPQNNHGYSSTFVDNEQYRASRTSPSPFTAAKAVLFAKYQQ